MFDHNLEACQKSYKQCIQKTIFDQNGAEKCMWTSIRHNLKAIFQKIRSKLETRASSFYKLIWDETCRTSINLAHAAFHAILIQLKNTHSIPTYLCDFYLTFSFLQENSTLTIIYPHYALDIRTTHQTSLEKHTSYRENRLRLSPPYTPPGESWTYLPDFYCSRWDRRIV